MGMNAQKTENVVRKSEQEKLSKIDDGLRKALRERQVDLQIVPSAMAL